MVKTGERLLYFRELSQILDQNLKEVNMMNEKVRYLKVKIKFLYCMHMSKLIKLAILNMHIFVHQLYHRRKKSYKYKLKSI